MKTNKKYYDLVDDNNKLFDFAEKLEKENKQWKKSFEEYEETKRLYRHTEHIARILCDRILANDVKTFAEDRSVWEDAETHVLIQYTINNCNHILDYILELREEIYQRSRERSELSAENMMLFEKNQHLKKENALLLGAIDNQEKISAANAYFESLGRQEHDPEESDDDVVTDKRKKPETQMNTNTPAACPEQKYNHSENTKKKTTMTHKVDFIEHEVEFSDMMWKMLEVIGKEGLSKYPEIEKSAGEQTPGFIKSRLQDAAKLLSEMKVLDKHTLKLPVTPRVTLYELTKKGRRLFQYQFKQKPVESEIERVRKEHDNLEHGYGILDLADLFVKFGNHKAVYAYNRERAISVGNKQLYIPDLICVPKYKSYVEYFEYERGTHTQKDFNEKCNKMCQVTSYLNFIAPNKSVLNDHLRPQIETWIASKNNVRMNIHIRLTTATELRDNKTGPESWLTVYDLNKSDVLVKNRA